MAHVLSEFRIIPKQQQSEATSLAKELGLQLQAKRYEKSLAEDTFQSLTGDEEVLWRHHCPTIYFTPPVAEGNRSIENYGFDSIPVEVMRHWKAIKDNYAFDSYEIWTTEKTPRTSDPLLIGVVGAKHYLLARWGLEAPGELSLKQIAAEYIERFISEHVSQDYPFQSAQRQRENAATWGRQWSHTFVAAERLLK